MEIKELSLKDILIAKEERALNQKLLIYKFKSSLISYKLNTPGKVKDNFMYRKIFNEGFLELLDVVKKQGFNIIYYKNIYKSTGPESYICIEEDAFKIKKSTTLIEENHELGRLFDIDVLDKEYKQISRVDLGLDSRKCFLCCSNAFECARDRKHTIEELIEKIHLIADSYFYNKN